MLRAPELLQDAPVQEDVLKLEEAPEGEEVLWDYSSIGLTGVVAQMPVAAEVGSGDERDELGSG